MYKFGWWEYGLYRDAEGRLYEVAYGPLNVTACARAYSEEQKRLGKQLGQMLQCIDSGALWKPVSESAGVGCTVTTGFPVHAFQGGYLLAGAPPRRWTATSVDSCWTLGQDLGDPNPQIAMTVMPYGPIYPGVIADTLIWGSAIWGTWIMWRVGRATWRRHAGRCERCGYLLTGAGDQVRCPECGS